MIVGIDLGTTNSLVAVVKPGKNGVPEVLGLKSPGQGLVPSVVSVIEGRVTVGRLAKRNQVLDASVTASSVKRLLGRKMEDLSAELSSLPFKVEESESEIKVRLGSVLLSPIEISALILKELKLGAEHELGEPVTQAVITVPAYFNDSQRQATRAAGRMAGLQVLRIINEPTAAALAYGLDRKRDGLIAVYDLGGGTFDVSILKLSNGIFEVLATHGDTTLGGDDLDRVILEWAVDGIRSELGVDLLTVAETSLETKAELLEKSENLKKALSTQDQATFEFKVAGQIFKRDLTRPQFEAMVAPLLERTRAPCLAALQDAGLKASDLSDVVLVGGPTRLAIVQKMATQIFGRAPNTSVHPDQVVAVGAAIQADILSGNNPDLLLLDVVPLSLGIETYGGLMNALISRNTRIPTVAEETFTTYVDRQTGVDIHVLQGERERVEDNRSLARFKLKGIPPQPAGIPRIKVTFLIDADGILQVSAKELKTGAEQAIEVKPSYGLTDAEVESRLKDFATNESADQQFKRLVEARTDASPVLQATEKHLSDARRLLPEDEAQAIEEALSGLRTALTQNDPDQIRNLSYHLTRATEKLAKLIVEDASSRRS